MVQYCLTRARIETSGTVYCLTRARIETNGTVYCLTRARIETNGTEPPTSNSLDKKTTVLLQLVSASLRSTLNLSLYWNYCSGLVPWSTGIVD